MGYRYIDHLTFLNETYKVLPDILWAMMAIVGGAGCVYAIILGINLAKAESEDKRKTASTRLKNTVIGVAVLIFLVLFINILLPLILRGIWPKSVLTEQQYQDMMNGTGGSVTNAIRTALSLIA